MKPSEKQNTLLIQLQKEIRAAIYASTYKEFWNMLWNITKPESDYKELPTGLLYIAIRKYFQDITQIKLSKEISPNLKFEEFFKLTSKEDKEKIDFLMQDNPLLQSKSYAEVRKILQEAGSFLIKMNVLTVILYCYALAADTGNAIVKDAPLPQVLQSYITQHKLLELSIDSLTVLVST